MVKVRLVRHSGENAQSDRGQGAGIDGQLDRGGLESDHLIDPRNPGHEAVSLLKTAGEDGCDILESDARQQSGQQAISLLEEQQLVVDIEIATRRKK
jgi:hypothetical protein